MRLMMLMHGMRPFSLASIFCLCVAAAGLHGCAAGEEPTIEEGFRSAHPGDRLKVIRLVIRRNEAAERIPELIESLDSDDPAVRFVAINALRDQTGRSYGYDYAAPPWERKSAVDRWHAAYESGELNDRPGPTDAEPETAAESADEQ